MTTMIFPTLETDRLILREWKESDLNDLYEIFRHDSVLQYTGSYCFKTVDDALKKIEAYKSYIEKELGLSWAVVEKETNTAIGSIDYTYLKKHYRVELGCCFTPSASGQGFGFESMEEIIRYSFEDFQLFKIHRLEAGTDPRNRSAKKLLEKLGFKDEALLRDYYFERGKFVDQHIFGLLREEWEKKTSN
jgi:ribosomal-protein-alanine N-acetyltransferase